MRTLLTILLTLPLLCFAQYPIVEGFTSIGGAGEWTTDYGGYIETYGGDSYLAFADWPLTYSNSTTHTATSPIYDLTDCAVDIEISFPISGLIEDGFDYLYFDYFDGGVWVNDVSYTGSQNTTYANSAIPNTTTQFRFRLVTDVIDPEYLNRWYADNLNGSWAATQNAQRNTRIDRSTQYIGFRGGPKQVLPYYYDISSFTISCSAILPIELMSFDGEEVNGNVILKWVTGSEINNEVFEIYSSIDSENWNLVGTKFGAGNSSQTLTYYFTDSNVGDINYYKIKQIDYDGNHEYSKIISVSIPQYGTEKRYDYYNVMGQKVAKNYKGITIKLEKY